MPEDVLKPGTHIPLEDFPVDIEPGDVVEVVMSEWFNPKDFFVQLRSNVPDLEQMMQNLNKFCNSLNKNVAYNAEFLPGLKNLYVAALYYNAIEKKFEGNFLMSKHVLTF